MAHPRSPAAACSLRRLSTLMACAVVLLLASVAPPSVAAARVLAEAPHDTSLSSMAAAEQPAEGTVLTIEPASAGYNDDDPGADLLDRIVHAAATP